MGDLFTTTALVSLLTLVVLEIVLGIDNVIFVSIVMSRLPKGKQRKARLAWMFSGITVRSILLLCVGWLVANGDSELFTIAGTSFGLRSLIMFAGGGFLMIKTVSEIHNNLEGDEEEKEKKALKNKKNSLSAVILQIMLIDAVFSFDSVITAIGIAKHVEVMITAVIVAMILMFFFSKKISEFVHQHPTFKILGLSFLVMVGFMLFFDGLEPLHHQEIPKGYVYVAMAFAFVVEVLNMRMRKKRGKSVELHGPKLREE